MSVGQIYDYGFAANFDTTHVYLKHMGARIAHDKSTNFATHRLAREGLDGHTWKHRGGRRPVKHHHRDLGAHPCFKQTWSNTTGSDRLQLAADMTDRAAALPAHYSHKAEILRGKVLPKALYGCEAAELPMARCNT